MNLDFTAFYEANRLQLLSSHSDGWGLFNLDTPLSCGIERYDEVGVFDGDYAALRHVAEVALAGSLFHAQCIVIHALCDEHRREVWGDAFVTSRLGPDQ